MKKCGGAAQPREYRIAALCAATSPFPSYLLLFTSRVAASRINRDDARPFLPRQRGEREPGKAEGTANFRRTLARRDSGKAREPGKQRGLIAGGVMQQSGSLRRLRRSKENRQAACASLTQSVKTQQPLQRLRVPAVRPAETEQQRVAVVPAPRTVERAALFSESR